MSDNVLSSFTPTRREERAYDHTFRVGIIGTGWIAEAHAESYLNQPDVKIVALADLIPGKAEAFAKRYGLTDARCYPDHKSLLASERLDAVSVCTYNTAHAQCTIDALAAETGRDAKAITAFKNLAFRAVAEASSELEGQNDVGILVDDTYGQSVLFESNCYPFWVGRSIEKTGVNPLMFEGKADVGSTLQAWPENHVVKCLFRPGAKDAPEVVEENERQLCRLFSGARSTGHDLLLEIIVDQPQTREEQDACLLRWMRRCYELGVYPDYWKILPVADQGTWQAIEALIGEYDPYCRGILFLGLNVAEAELVKRFAALPESPRALGFAIGRSIFLEPARKWFAGQMSDEDAVATMRDCFLRLARAWNGRNRG